MWTDGVCTPNASTKTSDRHLNRGSPAGVGSLDGTRLGLGGELTPGGGVTPAGGLVETAVSGGQTGRAQPGSERGRRADGETLHLARYYGTTGADQGPSSLDFWLLRRWLEQTELFEFVGETCTV